MINNEENKKVKIKKNTLQNISMLIGSVFLGVALIILFITTIMSDTVYTITYHDEHNQVNENITSLTSEDEVKLIDLEEQQDNNGYGFRFVGWSTDEEFTNIIDSLKNVSSDMDLYASYEKYSIGLSYTSNGDMVDGLGTVTHKDIIIPSKINGNDIIGIEENAFLESDITSVYIPDSIVKINDFAFSTCTSLVDIRFPDKLTTVGTAVFIDCVLLASIELPENITTLGMLMFYGCTSLTSVTIPSSVTNLPDATFAVCSQLETVNLSDGLLSIGEGAFAECTSLVSIELPNSVTNIDTHLFVDCTSLTTVVLPKDLTELSNYFFDGCTSLQNIVIPDSVTYIGNQFFLVVHHYKIL